MTGAEALTDWRAELEQSHRRVRHSVELAVLGAGEQGRADGARDQAESLKQTVRLLRKTRDESSALTLIVNATACCCTKAAIFVLEQGFARLLTERNLDAANLSIDLSIELSKSAALFAAIDSQDPVVAVASASELSADLYRIASAGFDAGERAYLFPLVVRDAVVAVLFAIGQVKPVPLELLAEITASHMESLRPNAGISPAQSETPTQQNWKQLSPKLQAEHLRAQRFARLKVSEMRVYHPEEVRIGINNGNIYGALKVSIDEARSAYRKEFAGVFDYLYIELVGNLANNDDRLLGPEFPGPIA